jgi:hypothetical protein
MSVIPPREVEFVEQAAKYMENPSFLVRLADIVGMPLEAMTKLAPSWVSESVTLALRRGLDFSLFTLPTNSLETNRFSFLEDRVWWVGYRHSAVTALTGGAGGLFGTLGLCVELPVTTCVMLRSMAAIAAVYGEDLRDTKARIECLSLFGMGAPSSADDEMDSSYLTVRASLGTLVSHAAKFVAHTPSSEVMLSIKNGTAPTLVKLLGKISRRFEMTVSEKLMAQAIPVVGALGGATVNVMFAEHFNAIARYHFGLRHLERRWGDETIRVIYEEARTRFGLHKRRSPSQLRDFGYRGESPLALPTSKPR